MTGRTSIVLPIVTRGPTENLNSLLYLRGVDLAIINSDSLEEYKVAFPDIRRHVTYLLNLFPSELHIFVRPEIQSLQDLAGKKVNFNTLGTAAAYSGPLIFSRLGINIEKTFIPHQVALQQMRKGDMAAVVFITSKPVDAFLRGQWEPGFKFLPVTYDSKFEDYYLPAVLEAADYPALIKPGERISTIAVPTVLVSYNWPASSTATGASPASPITSSAGSTSCRSLASTPTGRRSISARRFPASPASRRRRNGWTARRASRRTSNEDSPRSASLSRSRRRAPARWHRAPAMRWRSSAPARCWRLPNGWNAWTNSHATSRRRLRRAPSASAAPEGAAADNWIVSETTSPLDYSPVAIATASSSGGPDGATLQLSIQCRGGRTDLVIAGPALTRRGEDYVVSYAVNDGQPVVVAAGTPASGTGVAIRGDVVRLLASLPDRGEISFRVTPRQGAALDGRYALAGLKIVRDRLAGPCKWPAVAGAPRK